MRQPLNREAISAAAREILVTEGLHAVSLRRVAASLGVTAPALYAHVVDKRDLLQGIAEQEFDKLLREFGSTDDGDPVERLRNLSSAYIEWACGNADLFRAMFLFRPELTSEPRGDEPPLATKAFEAVVDAVRPAVESGKLRAGDDPRLAALALWTTVHGAATVLLAGPPLEDGLRNQLCHAAVDAVLAGLAQGGLESTNGDTASERETAGASWSSANSSLG